MTGAQAALVEEIRFQAMCLGASPKMLLRGKRRIGQEDLTRILRSHSQGLEAMGRRMSEIAKEWDRAGARSRRKAA